MTSFLGVDVGTGSVRAGLFDITGKRLGMGVVPIQIWKPSPDFAQQSSEDIWHACSLAIRAALAEAQVGPNDVAGIGFDATCSLVVLDADGHPLSISERGETNQDVIVWMDHRATSIAEDINSNTNNLDVLKYVGNRISPEMQIPKLIWLKNHLPNTWERAAHFFDLPDFLTFKATGETSRSVCSLTCKWTYLPHAGGFQRPFFERVGLADLAEEQFARLGTDVRMVGQTAGHLSARAATELGLEPHIAVATSMIDAHAGGLGVLGLELPRFAELQSRLALIGGTSTCHMAVSQNPCFVPGVWGPYASAMVPDYWLSEGGQSVTGALIDFVIGSHARAIELEAAATRRGISRYAVLNERLQSLSLEQGLTGTLASLVRDIHVLPDHHGNRSPRADALARGTVTGLSLDDSFASLALLYLATIEGLAHGTREVVEAMNANGHAIQVLIATGGDAKNPLFLQAHADITGLPVVLPLESESVILGAAMLGAVAAGAFESIAVAMKSMARPGRVIEPSPAVAAHHERKHSVFLRMAADQQAYRALMTSL